MKPVPNAAPARRGLALGAVVTFGLVLLAAAIACRRVSPLALGNGRLDAQFVVTSDRDAGPGTLRDAILACDRLSSQCHILIKAQRIVIESALPALINPHGIEIEATGVAGTIDAGHEALGPAIEIKGPKAVLTGIHILDAHGYGILINGPGADLTSVTLEDSKVGIMLGAGAAATIIRTSLLQHDETGLMVEAGIRNVALMSDIFRLNTRAGLWFVGAATASRGGPHGVAQDSPRLRVIDTVFEKNATGVVLANGSTLLRKDRFIDNVAALDILGGAARLEDSEIHGSEDTAVSVSAGRAVALDHNTLVDNKAAALMVRDSDVSIDDNTLAHNGLGLVLIGGPGAFTPLVKNNQITDNGGDAIMLIGGTALLQKNQLTGNHGAGLRPLDLVQGSNTIKAQPHLEHNVFHANGMDVAPTALYRLKGPS